MITNSANVTIHLGNATTRLGKGVAQIENIWGLSPKSYTLDSL